MGIVCNNS